MRVTTELIDSARSIIDDLYHAADWRMPLDDLVWPYHNGREAVRYLHGDGVVDLREGERFVELAESAGCALEILSGRRSKSYESAS